MSDDKKVIFSMSGITKTFQSANTPVLKNIYLSFFYGAKIGILGLNGSGKSTLLKIIAGVDKNYQGDVVFSPGYTVGYLEQEPQLDDNKTVMEVVNRLLQFEWECDREAVKDGLSKMLLLADAKLDKSDKEHRNVSLRLMETLEDLERPCAW